MTNQDNNEQKQQNQSSDKPGQQGGQPSQKPGQQTQNPQDKPGQQQGGQNPGQQK